MKNNNEMVLKDISFKNKNTIIYGFECTGKISKYFLKEDFIIKYDFSLTDIPKSILVIPFVSNVLPLIWIENATLKIDEIDNVFFENISMIKKGYQKMIPKIKLKGKINCKKIVNNKMDSSSPKKSICFFSGGVDSTSSLVNHLNEDIETFTIWGSDMSVNNINGWNNIKNHIEKVTSQLRINANYCKSNFRNIINYKTINNKIEPIIHDNYWHAYQHSIAIISHAVPYCFKYNFTKIYFPATITPRYGKRICASIPDIDNNFAFANTTTVHDGYNNTRLEKIKNITKYNHGNNNWITLRVCWKSLNGKNCTHCEKCFRTIVELLSIGEDPKNYSFDIINSTYSLMKYNLSNLSELETKKYKIYYHEAIEEIKNKKIDDNIKWILELNKF